MYELDFSAIADEPVNNLSVVVFDVAEDGKVFVTNPKQLKDFYLKKAGFIDQCPLADGSINDIKT